MANNVTLTNWLKGVAVGDPAGDSSFTRTSVAFENGVSHAANTPRYETIAVPSVPTSRAWLTGKGAAGADTIPHCVTTGGVLISTGANATGLYRSTDGGTTQTRISTSANINGCWALANGRILLSIGADTAMKLYTCDDAATCAADGATFVAGQEGGADLTIGRCISFNFAMAANGTMIAAEYPSSGGATSNVKLHRSTDNGATWTAVHTEASAITHYHGGAKHEATGRWIWSCGDATLRKLIYSDDDGATWADYTSGPDLQTIQPLYFVDCGDAKYLLAADDYYGGCCKVDATMAAGTGLPECVQTNFPVNWDASSYMCWMVTRQNGVYYAANYDSAMAAPNRAHIMVSTDLQHWALLHQFVADEPGAYVCAGLQDGLLHFNVKYNGSAARHFAIAPVTVENVNALVLEPAATNLELIVGDNSFEGGIGNWGKSAALTLTRTTGTPTVPAHSGSEFLRVTGNGVNADSLLVSNDWLAALAGKTIQASAWVRGKGRKFFINLRRADNPYANNFTNTIVYFTPSENEWTLIKSEPMDVLAAGSQRVELQFGMDERAGNPLQLDIDDVMLCEVPLSRSQPGATVARTADTWTDLRALGAAWSNVFTVGAYSQNNHPAAAAADLYLRTWKLAADKYLELYFDVSASKFVLAETGTPLLTSAVCVWPETGTIKLGIRYDGTNVEMDIVCGAALDSQSDVAVEAWTGAASVMYGDNDAANGFPMALANDWFYDTALSDGDLATEMNRTSPPADGGVAHVGADQALIGVVGFGASVVLLAAGKKIDGAAATSVTAKGAAVHGGAVQNLAVTAANPVYRFGRSGTDSGNGSGVIEMPSPAAGACAAMAN